MRMVWLGVAVACAGCGGDDFGMLQNFDLAGADLVGVPRDDGGATHDLAVSLGDGPPDVIGPTIAFLSPLPDQYIFGNFAIEVKIDDPSGIDDASVVATVSDLDVNKQKIVHTVAMKREGNGVATDGQFIGVYQGPELSHLFFDPEIKVYAADVVGNYSTAGEGVFVDNSPPAIDLDPPKTRVRKWNDGWECSQAFDPLGDESSNDGDQVFQAVWLKARVEDRGNYALGLAHEHVSKVDPASVELWVIQATDAPLIVDTDGDGFCDDVNPELKPSTQAMMPKEALVMSLVPVPSGGAPDFTPDNQPAAPGCAVNGDGQAMAPQPLCGETSLSFMLGYTNLLAESSVWSPPPVKAMDLDCQGLQVDAANRIADGPVCATVRARDNAANRNVAPPLRLCVNKYGKNGVCDPQLYQLHGDSIAPGHGGLPDCTGTVVNGKVTQTPCKPGVLLNTGDLYAPPFPAPGEPFPIN